MLVQAFAFKRWADARTLDAVESIDQGAHGRSYAFTLQQLNHMVIVEELFRSRLLGETPPHSRTNTDQVPGLDVLGRRLDASNDWYSEFINNLDSLERRISFVFADGRPGTMNVEEILFHIITHGSYHRGSIAHALEQAGVPHPVDGYGIYIHAAEPRRREA